MNALITRPQFPLRNPFLRFNSPRRKSTNPAKFLLDSSHTPSPVEDRLILSASPNIRKSQKNPKGRNNRGKTKAGVGDGRQSKMQMFDIHGSKEVGKNYRKRKKEKSRWGRKRGVSWPRVYWFSVSEVSAVWLVCSIGTEVRHGGLIFLKNLEKDWKKMDTFRYTRIFEEKASLFLLIFLVTNRWFQPRFEPPLTHNLGWLIKSIAKTNSITYWMCMWLRLVVDKKFRVNTMVERVDSPQITPLKGCQTGMYKNLPEGPLGLKDVHKKPQSWDLNKTVKWVIAPSLLTSLKGYQRLKEKQTPKGIVNPLYHVLPPSRWKIWRKELILKPYVYYMLLFDSLLWLITDYAAKYSRLKQSFLLVSSNAKVWVWSLNVQTLEVVTYEHGTPWSTMLQHPNQFHKSLLISLYCQILYEISICYCASKVYAYKHVWADRRNLGKKEYKTVLFNMSTSILGGIYARLGKIYFIVGWSDLTSSSLAIILFCCGDFNDKRIVKTIYMLLSKTDLKHIYIVGLNNFNFRNFQKTLKEDIFVEDVSIHPHSSPRKGLMTGSGMFKTEETPSSKDKQTGLSSHLMMGNNTSHIIVTSLKNLLEFICTTYTVCCSLWLMYVWFVVYCLFLYKHALVTNIDKSLCHKCNLLLCDMGSIVSISAEKGTPEGLLCPKDGRANITAKADYGENIWTNSVASDSWSI